MVQPQKASLRVAWKSRAAETISVQYNPTELSFDKSVQLAEVNVPGLDAPLQQFVRGQAERLTVELFFDTTDQGMGQGATSVTSLTDKIYQLVKIEPERHAPPTVTFIWSEHFPGSSLGAGASDAGAAASLAGAAAGALGAVAGAVGSAVAAIAGAIAGAAAPMGNQARNGFQGVVESVRQKLTLFSPEGIPLRATVTVVIREYSPLQDQLARLNLTSPDRTHAHVWQRGDSLPALAGRFYGRPAEWRAIADENGLEDPRRVRPGTPLTVPSLTTFPR